MAITQEQAIELAKAFQAEGLTDVAATYLDTSQDGRVVKIFRVEVATRDPRTGVCVAREFRDMVDAHEAAQKMLAELKERGTQTRTRIRRERRST